MTVSFVTIVPCAYVTGTKKSMFSIGTNLYVTRARDNGDKSQKRKVGNVLKLENAAGTLCLLVKNPSGS